jgi:lipid-binding SYLF domain-containing protein
VQRPVLSWPADAHEDRAVIPDKGIPQDLLDKGNCVVIVPGLKKGAFIVGAEFGKGFVTCRKGGGWSAPAAVRVEGGSFGFQIGGQETDIVLLIMNQSGADRLLSNTAGAAQRFWGVSRASCAHLKCDLIQRLSARHTPQINPLIVVH